LLPLCAESLTKAWSGRLDGRKRVGKCGSESCEPREYLWRTCIRTDTQAEVCAIEIAYRGVYLVCTAQHTRLTGPVERE
jgi:hypothetical protein